MSKEMALLKLQIENRILAYQEYPVMNNQALAEQYQTETSSLNQARKRKVQHISKHFYAQHTRLEKN